MITVLAEDIDEGIDDEIRYSFNSSKFCWSVS